MSTLPVRGAIASLALVAGACGSAPHTGSPADNAAATPSSEAPAVQSPEAPSSTADASAAAPGDASAGATGASRAGDAATPGAAGATASAAAPQASPAPAGPAPLTPAEQQEAERKCKPVLQALNKVKAKGGGDPLEAFREVVKNPPKMPKADLERCTGLMERGLVTYLIAAKEVEAKTMMLRFAKAMVAAYNQNGKLCPSSERAIPADRALVETEAYASTDADWNTPAWKCLELNMTGLQQRFQYEVRSDLQAKTFEIIARGAPGGKGQWVELHQKGTVKPQGIELGPIERK